MATSGTMPASSTRVTPATMVVTRILGAAALLAMAGIHFFLWGWDQYDQVPIIGPLFLINAVVGVLLTVAICVVPWRMLAITATLSALFDLGTLFALLVSIFWGLFGVRESFQYTIVTSTVVVEIAGVAVLAVLASLASRRAGMWTWLPEKS
jgi:hypothetical protein